MAKRNLSQKKSNIRSVRLKKGKWINIRQGAKKAATAHETQSEASRAAKEMLIREGGGELVIFGADGHIRKTVRVRVKPIHKKAAAKKKTAAREKPLPHRTRGTGPRLR